MTRREISLYGKIAWRNVMRNQRRSMLTILGIVFGAMSLVLFSGFIAGLMDDLRELTIHSRLGHLQLTRPGYRDFGTVDPVKYSITEYRAIHDELVKMKGVREVTKRLEFYGLLSNGDSTVNFFATGVEPEIDARMNTRILYREGHAPSTSEPNGVAVGIGLATKVHLHVGSEFTLLVNYGNNSVNAVDAKVVGVFESGIEEYDGVAITVPMGLTNTLLSINEDTAHQIVITLDSTPLTREAAAQVSALAAAKGWNVELKTWEELAVIYQKVVGLFDAIFLFIRLVIVVVVIFSVSNTITMSIYERFREIGSIRAIGTTRAGLATIFLFEGAIIGFLGGLAGVVMAMVPRLILNRAHIWLPPPPVLTVGAPLKVMLEPLVMVEIMVGATLVALLASYLPARKAMRVEIINALRTV